MSWVEPRLPTTTQNAKKILLTGKEQMSSTTSSRCAGQTISGERCKNKAFDGQLFCFRHSTQNKNLSTEFPCDEGFNPYYDMTDAAADAAHQQLPEKARDLLDELKVLIRKNREVFDAEHLDVLNQLRRELRGALDHGADESVVLMVLHELRACACSKKALKEFVKLES